MERSGITHAVRAARRRPGGPVVLGLCGGYQMLGASIDDAVESGTGRRRGLDLLDVATVFEATKVTRRRRGAALGVALHGYQIHHGRVHRRAEASPWLALDDGAVTEAEGCRSADGRVLGTTLHGLFEDDRFRAALLGEVARLRGRRHPASSIDFAAVRQAQFDLVADALEASFDMAELEDIITQGAVSSPR
jgi:adenosylcobyric acid synthase